MTTPGRLAGRFAAALVLSLPAFAARADEAPAVRAAASGVVDTWHNTQGGLGAGSAQVAEIDLRVDVDAERVFGWRSTTLSVTLLQTDSKGPTSRLLGDLQTADNRDATSGGRLYEAWIRRELSTGYAKAGIIDLNSEFNVSDAAALFINGAQGLGLDLGQVGSNGPSVFPDPRLGFVAVRSGPTSFKAGVFDGFTDTRGPRRRSSLSDEHGLVAIAETSRSLPEGPRFWIGAWRASANYGSTLEPVRRRPASGGYAGIEAPLWVGANRALHGLLRVGAADPKTEQVALHVTGDLVLERPFSGLEGEALGLGIVSAWNGDHALARGLRSPESAKRAETTIELTYKRPLSQHLILQPDIQYVIHPGALRARKDALLVGLRFGFAWNMDP